MSHELVQVKCRWCRQPELFPADKVGRTVQCQTRPRNPSFKLPAGPPFGAERWDKCKGPRLLRQALQFIEYKPPERAKIGFAIAVVNLVYPKTRRKWVARAVAFAEQFLATGTAPVDQEREILNGLLQRQHPWARPPWALAGMCCIAHTLFGWPWFTAADSTHPGAIADLLREFAPNPFRPQPEWSAWRTPTVCTLAAHIDAARDFGAMPIRADALQDAGCDDESVLRHCRGKKPHARGCWVLDAVLAKS